jgi:hypothetical protein
MLIMQFEEGVGCRVLGLALWQLGPILNSVNGI